MRIAHEKFERLVREENRRVMKALAPALRTMAEKVTIIAADHPSPSERGRTGADDLLGLYEGVSLTDRRVDDMETVADVITLFRLPLMRNATARKGCARKYGSPSSTSWVIISGSKKTISRSRGL